MTYDLSILIPSRNEMFTARTVEDILKNKQGNTEIIVGLDGKWADPGIEDHSDVRIIYVSEPLGQRAMTNKLARMSRAKYVMKVDAHCSFDEGFDVKLMSKMQDNWTVAPLMKNLHAFDWKCYTCGSRWYQGPTPFHCMKNIDGVPGKGTELNSCEGRDFRRKIVWSPKLRTPQATSYRFDRTLHFQYFPEFRSRPEGQGDVTPSMSMQGSCFMLTREKYFELDICDEKAGSWGHQGTEVALKTWLSGGQVMINQTTWYAHMFRTQGGDFSFPYEQPMREVEKAREYIRGQFVDKKWDKAVYDIQWLVDKFAPVPDWNN